MKEQVFKTRDEARACVEWLCNFSEEQTSKKKPSGAALSGAFVTDEEMRQALPYFEGKFCGEIYRAFYVKTIKAE